MIYRDLKGAVGYFRVYKQKPDSKIIRVPILPYLLLFSIALILRN